MEFLKQCTEAMNAYRQLTQDKHFASRAEDGKLQLVYITYGEDGKSTVEERGPWVPVAEWLSWLKGQTL